MKKLNLDGLDSVIFVIMRRKYFFGPLIILLFAFGYGDTGSNELPQWISFEDAVVNMESQPKKIFIDVYTDWCGWCKKMDAGTFSDPAVAEMLNSNFYPVKFNAEQTEPIVFRDYTFKFVPNGRRGYHELAASILNGKLSYPSVVFLNDKFEIIQVLPGYRNAEDFLKIATYIGEDHYLDTSWEDFQLTYSAKTDMGE